MKKISQFAAIVIIGIIQQGIVGGQEVMTNSEPLKVIDTIDGRSFVAIRDSMEVFQRHNKDLRQYTIEIAQDGDSAVVIFVDQNEPSSTPSIAVRQRASPHELDERQLRALMSTVVKRDLATIQGRSFLVIQAALPAFLKSYTPQLEEYSITVLRESNSLGVIFVDASGSRGVRGSPGKRPGFEVRLDVDLRVIRSSFIR